VVLDSESHGSTIIPSQPHVLLIKRFLTFLVKMVKKQLSKNTDVPIANMLVYPADINTEPSQIAQIKAKSI
jgi:hypothetical protein